jgi:hypothetical protein
VGLGFNKQIVGVTDAQVIAGTILVLHPCLPEGDTSELLIGTVVLLAATSASAQSSGPGGYGSAFGGGVTGGPRGGGGFVAPRPTAADRAWAKRFLARYCIGPEHGSDEKGPPIRYRCAVPGNGSGALRSVKRFSPDVSFQAAQIDLLHAGGPPHHRSSYRVLLERISRLASVSGIPHSHPWDSHALQASFGCTTKSEKFERRQRARARPAKNSFIKLELGTQSNPTRRTSSCRDRNR